MFIDHITVAGPDLAELQMGLAAAGLSSDYGGVHGNGITHMALAGFMDGSYLEIVSPLRSDGRISLWHDFALPYRGGTAWTIGSDDVGGDLARARKSGIETRGPVVIRREKPDGEVGAWELGYLGSGQPGGVLPFLIHDLTARSVRVKPSAGFGEALQGWSAIVLAVHDREAAASQFHAVYGWKTNVYDGDLLHFAGTPVYLTSSQAHLAEFGESPCAATLRAADSRCSQLQYSNFSKLAGGNVGWLDLPWKNFRIGVEAVL